jgi:hypothetical protein
MKEMSKYLIVHKRIQKNIYAHTEITKGLELFLLHEVGSKYAKSILSYEEISQKVFLPIWRICTKNLAVFSKYAKTHKSVPISANF